MSKEATSILFLETFILSLTKLLVILTGGGTHLVRLHHNIVWEQKYKTVKLSPRYNTASQKVQQSNLSSKGQNRKALCNHQALQKLASQYSYTQLSGSNLPSNLLQEFWGSLLTNTIDKDAIEILSRSIFKIQRPNQYEVLPNSRM